MSFIIRINMNVSKTLLKTLHDLCLCLWKGSEYEKIKLVKLLSYFHRCQIFHPTYISFNPRFEPILQYFSNFIKYWVFINSFPLIAGFGSQIVAFIAILANRDTSSSAYQNLSSFILLQVGHSRIRVINFHFHCNLTQSTWE